MAGRRKLLSIWNTIEQQFRLTVFQLNICKLTSAFVLLLSISYEQNGFKASHIANTRTLAATLKQPNVKHLAIIFLLIISLGCSDKSKRKPTNQHKLALPNFSVFDCKFPLKISDLNLKDSSKIIYLNDGIESKLSQTIYSYYFNDCSGDSSETYFSVKDTYINTLRLHDSLTTVYLILFKVFPGGQVDGKLLFYDNIGKDFIDKSFDLRLFALYDLDNGELKPTNLKEQFKITYPEISLVDFDNDKVNDFKFTRLYHNGTANAIETTIIKIYKNKIDTLDFKQNWIGLGTGKL
jgi:hypothetical protein